MTVTTSLPPAEKTQLTLGFMRLTDSAPLVYAKEKGLFKKYGLRVNLVRDVSWANLRDKLVVGKLDAAHLLAPMPMMTRLGSGSLRVKLLTGLSLSLNGNGITLSKSLWNSLNAMGKNTSANNATAMAQALKAHLNAKPQPIPTFATVHAFSMHSLQLHMWLNAGGINPNRDVRIIVLPPEQMGDNLARGIIDGFCVGEPWNTLAVQQGSGAVAATGYDIWNNGPEKVLGVTEHWHNQNPASHLRLRLALMEACQALDEAAQRQYIAECLSRPEYLDLPIRALLPSLTGQFQLAKHLPAIDMPDFHVFHRYQAGFPWRSQAQWMLKSSSHLLGQRIGDEQCFKVAQQCYRPDLYCQAARYLGWDTPQYDSKKEDSRTENDCAARELVMGADKMIGNGVFVDGV